MKYRPGDKVRLEGTVTGVDGGSGWLVVTSGYNAFTIDAPELSHVELVDRPKTPGQRAYEEWLGPDSKWTWDMLKDAGKARWEGIAEAVTAK